ncbi:hypothetical protein H5410_033169, partial [Solanum commersonii]
MLTDKPCRPMLLYQADVCDACQLLIKGEDVYKGVSKADAFRHRLDYTRHDVNVDNFLAVLFGNQTALTSTRKMRIVVSGVL